MNVLIWSRKAYWTPVTGRNEEQGPFHIGITVSFWGTQVGL